MPCCFSISGCPMTPPPHGVCFHSQKAEGTVAVAFRFSTSLFSATTRRGRRGACCCFCYASSCRPEIWRKRACIITLYVAESADPWRKHESADRPMTLQFGGEGDLEQLVRSVFHLPPPRLPNCDGRAGRRIGDQAAVTTNKICV